MTLILTLQDFKLILFVSHTQTHINTHSHTLSHTHIFFLFLFLFLTHTLYIYNCLVYNLISTRSVYIRKKSTLNYILMEIKHENNKKFLKKITIRIYTNRNLVFKNIFLAEVVKLVHPSRDLRSNAVVIS